MFISSFPASPIERDTTASPLASFYHFIFPRSYERRDESTSAEESSAVPSDKPLSRSDNDIGGATDGQPSFTGDSGGSSRSSFSDEEVVKTISSDSEDPPSQSSPSFVSSETSDVEEESSSTSSSSLSSSTIESESSSAPSTLFSSDIPTATDTQSGSHTTAIPSPSPPTVTVTLDSTDTLPPVTNPTASTETDERVVDTSKADVKAVAQSSSDEASSPVSTTASKSFPSDNTESIISPVTEETTSATEQAGSDSPSPTLSATTEISYPTQTGSLLATDSPSPSFPFINPSTTIRTAVSGVPEDSTHSFAPTLNGGASVLVAGDPGTLSSISREGGGMVSPSDWPPPRGSDHFTFETGTPSSGGGGSGSGTDGNPNATPSSGPEPGDKGSNDNVPVIVGSIFGVLLLIILAAFGFLLWQRRHRKHRHRFGIHPFLRGYSDKPASEMTGNVSLPSTYQWTTFHSDDVESPTSPSQPLPTTPRDSLISFLTASSENRTESNLNTIRPITSASLSPLDVPESIYSDTDSSFSTRQPETKVEHLDVPASIHSRDWSSTSGRRPALPSRMLTTSTMSWGSSEGSFSIANADAIHFSKAMPMVLETRPSVDVQDPFRDV